MEHEGKQKEGKNEELKDAQEKRRLLSAGGAGGLRPQGGLREREEEEKELK